MPYAAQSEPRNSLVLWQTAERPLLIEKATRSKGADSGPRDLKPQC